MADLSELLSQFDHQIRQRIAAEESLRKLTDGSDSTAVELQQTLSQLTAQFEELKSAIQEQYEQTREVRGQQFTEQLEEIEQANLANVRQIEESQKRETNELERTRKDSEWVVSSVMDDNAEDSPVREFEKFKTVIDQSRESQLAELSSIETALQEYVASGDGTIPDAAQPENAPKKRETIQEQFQETAEQCRSLSRKTESVLLAKIFRGMGGLIAVAVLSFLVGIPVFLFVDPSLANITGGRMQPGWIGIASGVGVAGGALLSVILWTLGSMKQGDLFRRWEQSVAEAKWLHQQWSKVTQQSMEREQKRTEAKQQRIVREREQVLKRYEQAHQQSLQEIQTLHRERSYMEFERADALRKSITEEQTHTLSQLDAEHEENLSALHQKWGEEIERAQLALTTHTLENQRLQSQQWSLMKSTWEGAIASFEQTGRDIESRLRTQSPEWNQFELSSWQPATSIPDELPVGSIHVDFSGWDGAIPEEMRLAPRKSEHELLSAVPFPDGASILFRSPTSEARDQAVAGMQSLMLRLLLTVPPGKIRFTLIDPVSLGESFAGFMHLADYDELMVTNRIWTEPGHIENRLADLTEHMENVLQKYLRNEFATIEDYNVSAGEVAEPYHFLMISDFPAKFSELAARRLISIVNSGPRCGVYTMLNLDPTKGLPNNFELSDIEEKMSSFSWNGTAFEAHQAFVEKWSLTIETPPSPEKFTSIVKMVGDASKDARRVEVAFDRIAPDAADVWAGDSRSELEIPLGRAGATKLQTMKLGRGTSQHMLVAGKTGSGKSTFLHIVITNLALHYSPDEVNFYLIDFKKGVEFKDYATRNLPHASVIAIESDREFGVSALQRLSGELQERGELFRRHGVQDIAGFRNANPTESMPRILLIVDEFQEFFIEDDKISQSATLLLDRLVRQGRAFGIHVILGSQTLGGAYSLARSTLGQVAVRVALQCSESDAHLILSEENTAARLLTRPGEAIYNDANGMLEGNHPFQIAWLTDEERDTYLDQMRERLSRSKIEVEPAIVFEGNIPSDVTRNTEITKQGAEFSSRATALIAPRMWLGDAVEIKPTTEIAFHRQTGSNVLMVGQDREAAIGILTTALAALATAMAPSTTDDAENGEPSVEPVSETQPHADCDVTHDPIKNVSEDTSEPDSEPALKELKSNPDQREPNSHTSSIYVLNGHPVDAPESAVWDLFAEELPVSIEVVSPRTCERALRELHAELKKRDADPETICEPIFIIVDHISKFRDLRKAEDDFGIGSFGTAAEEKPVEVNKIFSELLTQGPLCGIHTIVWCDSYNNVDRWLSRQLLREMEYRIAFQMNANDSSNFIQSPAASRLGTHRALLYREETGTFEKFRPYGLPSPDWIDSLRRQMVNDPDIDIATDLEEFSIL